MAKTKAREREMTVQEAERVLELAHGVIGRHRDNEQRRKNAAHVGRFYRYRNCYSCPQRESDYWWVYHSVLSIDEHGSLNGWSFQTDKDGKVTVFPRDFLSPVLLQEEIEEVDFYAAFDVLLADLERRRNA